MQELELSQSELESKVEELKTVKRENRKRRKMIEAYQDMLNHGATGLHPVRSCGGLFVLCASSYQTLIRQCHYTVYTD